MEKDRPGKARAVANFGGNQRWRTLCYRPADEAEVLEILRRHAHQGIRALGSLHSWSELAVCDEVTLDLSAFQDVALAEHDGVTIARVGAGCRLQTLLDRLRTLGGRTLPTLGVIKRQTVAGAVSTGTHGSGMQSLSHFVIGARAAGYDPDTGEPRVFEYRGGDALRAARCGLGCMGILLTLELAIVRNYQVEEQIVRRASLDEVLRAYDDFPLTQFALVPYSWAYLCFERRAREVARLSLRERSKGLFWRLYNRLWIDVAFHLFVKTAVALGPRAVRFFLRCTPSLSLEGKRIDDAERVLTMGHHYFRHEEMEFFVPQSRVGEALEVLRCATEIFAGTTEGVGGRLQKTFHAHGLYAELLRHRGTYTHHYPYSIRRLLPEDALVSMGSSLTEPVFSVSVFTYSAPYEREAYYAFCGWLARCMYALFAARLHWGKHFPLGPDEIALAYPELETFRRACRAVDPEGTLRKGYAGRLLGFDALQPVMVSRDAVRAGLPR
jgi:L-gulono-1,4-lactone dehydrogenase